MTPLRFPITSRPSRCEDDSHLLVDQHALHTIKRAPSGALLFWPDRSPYNQPTSGRGYGTSRQKCRLLRLAH
jgi:hypothetical protein